MNELESEGAVELPAEADSVRCEGRGVGEERERGRGRAVLAVQEPAMRAPTFAFHVQLTHLLTRRMPPTNPKSRY